MKKALLCLLTALLLLPAVMLAQGLGGYYFSTGTDATKWIPLTTTTSIITESGDSKASAVQNIGFTFNFAGTDYTEFSVNSDGNLRFGSTVTGTANYSTPFSASNANINNPKINMLGCDGYIELTNNSHVYHEVVGAEPNRICVIEFATSTYNTESRSAVLKWQVQLFEGSNDIQIVYPSTLPTINPNVVRQPGMCANASDIILINASHTVDFYNAGVASANVPIGNWPDADRYYLFTIPTDFCPRVSALTATNIGQTTAHVAWTGSGSEVSYDVVAVEGNMSPDDPNANILTVTDTYYDFTDLTASTNYNVYVRAFCGLSYSNWCRVGFRTECPDFVNIPYAEDFESYTGSTSGTTPNIEQACWSHICQGTSSTYIGYPIIYNSSTYANSGANSVRFYSYTTSGTYGDEYAVMPPVDVTTNPINTLQVEFSANKYSTYSLTLEVGVMNDSASVSSFEPVDTIIIPTTATANAYETFIVSFENYTGNGNRIAFKAPRSTSSYNAGCIDDVFLTQIPNCKKPMEVVVNNVTSNSVDVSWAPQGNESAWDVVVVEHGTSVDDGVVVTAMVIPFEVSGLTDNTQYDVYVRANCGGETSDWSNVISFTTRCLPNDIFPYTENFASYGTTNFVSFPNCWTRMTNYTSQYPYISSTYNHDGTVGSLYFYSTSAFYSLATTELMDMSTVTPGSLKVDFNLYKTSASYGRLDIGYMTDASDLNTFVVMKSIYPDDLANTSTWYDFSVIFPNEVYNQPVYIAFLAPAITTSYVYMDGVSINEVPDCSTPSNLSIAAVSGSTAILEWDAAPFGDNAYVIEYAESESGNWTSAIVNGTTYTITGLSAGTQYDVLLYSNCAETDTITYSFSTRAYLDCVQPGGTLSDEITAGTSITEYYVPVGNFYKYSYTQQIYTADEIDSTHTPTVITGVSFEYSYTTPTTSKTDVKIYLAHRATNTFASTNDWTPITDATLVYEGNLNCHQGWNDFTFDTPYPYNGVDNLVVIVDDNSNAYNGSAYVFNGHTPGSSTNYVSMYYQNDSSNPDPMSPPAGTRYTSRVDIKFTTCDQTVPLSCAAPIITDITSDDESVTLSWIPGLNETSWELEYRAAGQNDWITAGTVTASPYTVNGLNANSNYEFRIKTDCGGGEYSDWANASKKTTCAFETLPFTENFESATGSGAAYFIDCWTRGTNSSTQYPYAYSTQHYSGNYSLYFYGTATNYAYAASPRFADEVAMDSLLIQFYAYKTSAAYFIEVGIMEDPEDYSTFTTLGQFTPSATTTWEMGEFRSSNYTGNGHYVAFRVPASVSNYMYLDDVSINYIPSCSHVENLHAVDNSITPTTADIAWIAGGDESEWDVVFGPAGTVDLENSTPTTVYSNSISLTDLTGNTLYEVYVKSNCYYGESTWMTTTFRTACTSISSLPYMDDFDSYGTGTTIYPPCWGKINTYTSGDRPYINTTNYSAPGAMYFYAGTAGTYNIAIAPEFDASIPVNTLQATFMYRATYMTDRMIVGVMTNPSDASTFVSVDTIAPNATATWEEKNVDFTSYSGTGQYIAFKVGYTSTTCYGYMDNLVVDLAPGCDAPTDLTVDNVSSSSVELSWDDDASQSSWQVYIYEDGETPDFTQAVMANTNSYTTSDLTPNTVYHASVRTICADGSGYSNWRNIDFSTTSSNVAQVPYFHDFEDANENAEWMLNNGAAINKWYIGQPTEENDSVLFISNNGTAESYTISSAISTVWAYRDFQFGNASEFTLKFKWKAHGEGVLDYLKVYIGTPSAVQAGAFNCNVSTTTYDPAGAESLGYFNLQDNWQYAAITLNGSYANTTQRIYFRWSNDGSVGTAPSAVVDSIEITANACGRPYDLAVTNITSQSAEVSFEPANVNDNAWEYLISTVPFNPDNSTEMPTSINSTTFTLNTLAPNTPYYMYVRTLCAGGDYSEWSDLLSFRSDCDVLTTLPFSENFDSIPGQTTGTTNNLPPCWDNLCGTYSSYAGYPIVYSTSSYASSTPNSLRFYSSSSSSYDYGDQFAILPTMDVNALPLNNLQLTFDARKYSTSYATFTLYVGVMSDPADATTFVPVDTIVVTETTYDNYTVYFNNYTGNGNRIAIMSPQHTAVSINAGNVDNIVLDFIPTCPKPQNLTASNATTTSIDLSWTEIGSANTWNVEYGPAGFTQGTGTIVTATSNPFTVTGLNSATNYGFYVQADCGGGDVSPWSAVATAATECAVIALPYNENFDAYTGTAYNVAGVAPVCWVTTTNNTTYPAPHVVGSGTYYYPNSQPNCMMFTSSSAGADAFAVLPEFLNDLNTITMAFAYRMENASYGTMTVGYVTDMNNIATSFQTVATLVNTTTITLDTVSYENLPAGTTGRLAFHWNHNSTFYSCGIDDISVFSSDTSIVVPTCDAPTNLAVSNVTTTGATATWTAGGTETAWNLQYKAASAANWSNAIPVSAATYTFTGLTPNTQYQVRVQAACDATTTSDWTAAVSFTTAEEVVEPCVAPSNLTVYDIHNHDVTLTWQENGTATSWTIYYRIHGASSWMTQTVNTNTYTLTGLEGYTEYDYQVVSNCADGATSDPSNSVTERTTNVGIEDYDAAAISVFPNPTTGMVQVSSSKFQVSGVDVYDVYGKLLKTDAMMDNSTVDMSGYAAGVYFLRVSTENGVVTKRVVKR